MSSFDVIVIGSGEIIDESGGTKPFEEGCLSIPNVREIINKIMMPRDTIILHSRYLAGGSIKADPAS